MENLLPTLILTIGVLAFFVTALGIKMIFDKKAEFRGGCASNNPMLRNEIGECTVCGKMPVDDCDDKLKISTSDLPDIK